MAHILGWYIENEVIYLQYGSEVTVQEMQDLLAAVNAYVEQTQRPLVHIVIDLTRIVKPLSLVETVKSLKGVRPHPRMGWTITIGEQDKLVKFIASVARQIWGLRQRSFNSLPEALDFLRDIDTRLDWSKADNRVLTADM